MAAAPGIHEPSFYAGQHAHERFAELRNSDPVYWQVTDFGGFWAVLSHADVMHVSSHPEIYSSEKGFVVLNDLEPAMLAHMRNSLLGMDPSRHYEYRKAMNPQFRARVINQMEEQLRGVCLEVMESVNGRNELDAVHDLSAGLPTQMIGTLFGLPRSDWAMLHHLAEVISTGQDPGAQADSDMTAPQASLELIKYGISIATTRPNGARDDLCSYILAAQPEGRPMTDLEFGGFFQQLVTAGNDTTRTMLSSGLWALVAHPEQLQMLRDDDTKIPGAVEEILRWVNPLHYFRRTALLDAEIRGKPIAAGDKVLVMYTSANRDEKVFNDPQRFDITRAPNPHLSFGFGGHFCLGAQLSRLAGRVFFEELLDAFPTIELAGAPIPVRSNLQNSLRSVPVRVSSGGQAFDGPT